MMLLVPLLQMQASQSPKLLASFFIVAFSSENKTEHQASVVLLMDITLAHTVSIL